MNTKLYLTFSFALIVALSGAQESSAANLQLEHSPLFLNQSVEPNLAISFDDSGSMDRGHMPEDLPAYAGVNNGLGGDLGNPRDTGDDGNWRQPWATWFGYNTIYYNPSTNYALPKDADGADYPEIDFNNAPVNGYNPGGTKVNLANNYPITWGCCNNDGPNNITYGTLDSNDNNGKYMYQVGENTAFYHTYSGDRTAAAVANPANYTAVKVSGTSEEQNFARWFSYYRTRLLVSKSGITLGFSAVTAPIRVAWQGLNRNRLNGTGGEDSIRTLANAQRTDLWKYIDDTWTGSGGTPVRAATKRAGDFFKQGSATNTTAKNPYWDVAASMELSCRQNYHVTVTDGGWKDATGRNGDTDVKKIDLPDGVVYDPENGSAELKKHLMVYSNEADSDGDGVADIFNGDSGDNDHGFADNAMYYWATDLRGDLVNNVPRFLADISTGVTGAVVAKENLPNDPFDNDEIYWNPANDPASWQHMVHFNIGLGVSGEIPLTRDSLLELRKGERAWPAWIDDGSTPAAKIDDNWHAALNSRGRYFSATNPNELVRQLSQVLNSIVSRSASASAVAVSSGVLTTNAKSFRTKFNSGDWSGTVESVAVSDIISGSRVVQWDAGCNLTAGDCASDPENQTFKAPGDRNIYVVDGSGAFSEFRANRFGQLTTELRAALNTDPSNGVVDNRGEERLRFIRGDRSNEISNGGAFRDRGSVLGDIVNSGAVFVQGTVSRFENHSKFFGDDPLDATDTPGPEGPLADYVTFRKAQALRAGVVYSGANDGMLHAFDADTGEELWAFIPTPVQENLGALTDPQYVKQSYVDAGPAVQDAFIDGSWRTIMVGGLRLGGQGFYAFDITDPANPTLLWEFTDANDADLGYSFGEAHITRIKNGNKWVALLPSGYNAEEADGNRGSASGALFVVDLADGTVLHKFQSSAMNGLGPAFAGDYFADLIADVAFAGDIDGNLWRFDLEANTFEKMYNPATAGNQPITTRPTLMVRERDGAFVVIVGTGKYLEKTDRVTIGTPDQYLLAVFDRSPLNVVPGAFPATLAEMHENTLRLDQAAGNRFFNVPNTVASRFDPSADEGWYIELGESGTNYDLAGERVVTVITPRFATNRFLFSTLIPAGNDPCVAGGSSFVIAADSDTGGPVGGFASFDFDNDGDIDFADFKDFDGEGAGKQRSGLVVGVTPLVTPGGGEAIGLLGGDTGDGTDPTQTTIKFAEPDWIRRGWRQLFNEG